MMQMVMLQNLDQNPQAGSSAAMEQRLQQVEENGQKMEPIERVAITTPAGSEGSVIAALGKRK